MNSFVKSGGYTFRMEDSSQLIKTNDTENHIKRIEDAATPILKKIITDVTLSKSIKRTKHIRVTSIEWDKLSKYFALQIIRTPRGREGYFGDASSYLNRITSKSSLNLAKQQFVNNMVYILQLGTYGENGFSGKLKETETYFSAIFNIIKKSKPNIFILNKPQDQFIIGDHPCVALGEFMIDTIIMPLSPTILLKLSDSKTNLQTGIISIKDCPEALYEFSLVTEYKASVEKIIFQTNISKYFDLKQQILKSDKKWNDKVHLWSLSSMKKYYEEMKNDEKEKRIK
nr:DUF4238 domain-containing protein [Breznakia pachnodae]